MLPRKYNEYSEYKYNITNTLAEENITELTIDDRTTYKFGEKKEAKKESE